MVSPETRLLVSPSRKAASAAISKVQRLGSYPNSLGERWSISLKSSALLWSKASRVLLGREDLAARASRPLWLKSWMASRTVCCPQPRLRAILGAYSPLELASKIWHRRKVKAFFERNPAWVFTLLFGERTYKDWSFHGAYCNSQHETYLEDALGCP